MSEGGRIVHGMESLAVGRALGQIASDQCGLFTRAQAIACGYTAYQIRRRLATGRWRTVLGPVLARSGTRVTPDLSDVAAHLALDGSVLAGPSAARRHGIPVRDQRTYLAVGARDRRALRGVQIMREHLAPRDVMSIGGLLVTSQARTVFDCLRILPDRAATELLERALQAGWITAEGLGARVHLFAGRHGAKRLVGLTRVAAAGAWSAAERLAADLLRKGRISGWRANAEIYDDRGLIGVGDVVFEDVKLVVEVDGRAHHATPDRFQRDRERQNRLVAAGWTVLRFTWRDLVERPSYVLAAIRGMLTRLRA